MNNKMHALKEYQAEENTIIRKMKLKNKNRQ